MQAWTINNKVYFGLCWDGDKTLVILGVILGEILGEIPRGREPRGCNDDIALLFDIRSAEHRCI